MAGDAPRIDWDAVTDEATRLLSEFIRIDTSNPPGRELAACEWLAGLLRAEGIDGIAFVVHPRIPVEGATVAQAAGLLSGAIGSWQGVKLAHFLKLIGADLMAKYVWFRCAEGYSNTIDMPTALHPQTQLTLKFDHQILPRAYGFPMKIRIPTKLGFKNPKYVVAMEVTNTDKGGYWEDQGYNWFSGL